MDRRLNEAGARRVARTEAATGGSPLRATRAKRANRANPKREIQGPPNRSKYLSSLERKRDKRERTVPTGMPSVAATST